MTEPHRPNQFDKKGIMSYGIAEKKTKRKAARNAEKKTKRKAARNAKKKKQARRKAKRKPARS